MVPSGCPLLVTVARNACAAPSSTLVEVGVNQSAMSLTIASALLPNFLASAWLVAVTCTGAGDGRSIGAEYTPSAVIVPSVVLPPATPFTLQLTAASVVFVTDAVKVAWFPSRTVPFAGVTVMTIDGGGGGGGGGGCRCELVLQPYVHAPTIRMGKPKIEDALNLFPLLRGRGRMPT